FPPSARRAQRQATPAQTLRAAPAIASRFAESPLCFRAGRGDCVGAESGDFVVDGFDGFFDAGEPGLGAAVEGDFPDFAAGGAAEDEGFADAAGAALEVQADALAA